MKSYNFFELTKLLKYIAISHPLIGYSDINRYRLNSIDDICYPASIFLIQDINIAQNITTYSFQLLYADRITSDESNIEQVQSVGLQVNSEIINFTRNNFSFIDTELNTGYSNSLFQNQYADGLAGVITSFSLIVPSDLGECDYLPEWEDKCLKNCFK